MPTVEATQFKCPECGGRLGVTGDATSATCSYCGTVARVQRRTQFLQIPIRLEPAREHESPHVARQVRSAGTTIVAGVMMALVLGAILMAGLAARRSGTQRQAVRAAIDAGSKATAGGNPVVDAPSWNGGVPIIVDVDNDGVDDFIGIDRTVRIDTMRFAAYSGRDGRVVWETPSLGNYEDVYRDVVALVGDALIVADKKAHVAAFDVATGKPRWHVDTSEVVDRICSAKPTAASSIASAALVVTADHVAWSISLVDGTLKRATASCPEPSGRPQATGAMPYDNAHLRVAGMRVEYAYARGGGPVIATGYRSPGTSVPMLAAFDQKHVAIWHAEVPSQDPLTASTSDEHIAIGDHEVAAVYKHESHPTSELAVFERTTGARRFDTALQPSQMNVVSTVVLTRDAVAVSSWGNLQVFDVATGKLRFRIGE